MLTADSLNKATRRYWRILYIALLPLFVPLMIFNLSIAQRLANFLNASGVNVKGPTIGLVLIATWIALLFSTIFYLQKRFLPSCPSCHKRITPNNVGLVIATKHCPMCGALIVGQES